MDVSNIKDLFLSPAVINAHKKTTVLVNNKRSCSEKLRRKFKRQKYTGVYSKNNEIIDCMVDIAQQYPLCRFCLVNRGNICEHSHPIESDPRYTLAVRALTACPKCNAAERETLKEVCEQFGSELRTTHVDDWPTPAKLVQSKRLSERITKFKKSVGRSPLCVGRSSRILKF